MESRRGRPVWVRLTNVSDRTARFYKHSELPRDVRYARLNYNKYNEWQVLVYAEGDDETLANIEKELYECWFAEQPPAVERQEYQKPERILKRPTEASVASDGTSLKRLRAVETEIEAEIASGARGEDDDLYEHILNE
ncbi:hypothetical protein PHMEG_00035030, partial [Phytophthora megakarya]